tara:strand:+ start:676 stop:1002 length:327 start_codon:yes stop_codon:yes gene_type:complete
MNTTLSTLLIASMATVLSVGCASNPPTVGDKMISQSDSTRDLGKQWQDGKSLVKKGESIKAEGMDINAKGDVKVKEGDRLITEGKAMMQESEMIFKKRFPGQTLNTNP